MRVICANDVECLSARDTDCGEMIFRVHEVTGFSLLVLIAGAVDGLDRLRGAEEESTALLRPRLARVRANGSHRI